MPLRLLTALAVVLALALPAAGLGAPAVAEVDRGVVQSIGPGQIVLRTLDGGVAVVPGRRRARACGSTAVPAAIGEIGLGLRGRGLGRPDAAVPS